MPLFQYVQSFPFSFWSFFSLDGADVAQVESSQWVITNPENGYKLRLLGVFDKTDPANPTGNIKSLEAYAPDGTLVMKSLTNYAKGVTLQGFRTELLKSEPAAAGYLFSGD